MTPARAQFTHILDALDDGILCVNEDFGIEWMNEAAGRMLGGDGLPEKLADAIRTGEQRFDYRPASSDRCYLVRVRRSGTDLAVVLSDVTEQRRTEEAGRAREEQLQTLLAHTPDIVSRFDRDLRFIYINPAVEAVTGAPPEFWIGKTHEKAGLPPDVSECLRASLGKIFATRQRHDVEFEVPSPSGVRTLYGIGVPEFGDDGQVISALSIVRDITDVRRAESSREAEEQRLELAVRAHGMGIYDWNIQTGEVAWTEQEERLFGLEPGTFEGRIEAWNSRVHPEDRDRMTSLLNACIERREEVVDFAFRVCTPAGAVRWMEGSGRFLYATDGTPLRMVGVNYDATARIESATALRESHDRLRLVQSVTGVGLWDWDLTDDSVSWSDEIYEIVGVPRTADRFSADVWRAHVHPDDARRVEHTARAVLATGTLLDVEFRIVRADGDIRWILSRGTVVRRDDGIPVRMVGLNLDITERKRALEALEASEERQRLAADAGKIGLWDWDIVADRIVWSDRIYEMHGLRPGSFGGRVQDFASLVHKDDAERVHGALQQALATGEPYDIEFRTVRPDGEIRWLTTRARVLFGPDGKPLRMVGAVLDTTERRRTEEQLRSMNRELEEFAFVASHDLQEPLRTVRTFSQLLIRRYAGADADAHQLASYIGSSVEKMESLIRDLLAYSRTVHHEQTGAHTADLNEAFDVALSTVHTSLEERRAQIECAHLPRVAGETSQFAHVFQNLFSNSLKYSQNGIPPRISVSAERHGCEWIVSVRDNGIGFEQQYADRIFGLFRRLHRDAYPGSGLGLAICKRIVERYGGRIWAEGKPGEGAVFHFALPVPNE